jgi:hypothetical protein
MKHKLLHIMKKRDDSEPLFVLSQLDDVYWGRRRRGSKRRRGAPAKTPFATAVQTSDNRHPIALCLTRLVGLISQEIEGWAERRLRPATMAVSEGLSCIVAVQAAGCELLAIGDSDRQAPATPEALRWVTTITGNIGKAIHGGYRATSERRLPHYLAEFCYRFIHRLQIENLIPRPGYVATRIPYRLLKFG